MRVCTQAAHSQRVHMALGEMTAEEAHLNAVIELMLDITESSVAFCWELGAGKLQKLQPKLHILKLHVYQ